MTDSFTIITVHIPTPLIDFIDRIRYAEWHIDPTSRSDVVEAALFYYRHAKEGK